MPGAYAPLSMPPNMHYGELKARVCRVFRWALRIVEAGNADEHGIQPMGLLGLAMRA